MRVQNRISSFVYWKKGKELKMKRRKQRATTYISTLTVNFGNNQPTKPSKSHSAFSHHDQTWYRSEFKPTEDSNSTLVSSFKPQSSAKKVTSGFQYKANTSGKKEPNDYLKAVPKEIIKTTATTDENTPYSVIKVEGNSAQPANDYGETDWYLDLLLRMQSLEMKQQNLHAQYDFLGKLATENREGLEQARDWARYNADNKAGVEAY